MESDRKKNDNFQLTYKWLHLYSKSSTSNSIRRHQRRCAVVHWTIHPRFAYWFAWKWIEKQKFGHVSQNRNYSCLKPFKNAYVLNTGPFSMLANAKPTILPSVKPHIMSKPSDEIVKQSISDGNAMTFVLWLRPLIKSFSNKCNILSMATTTCSLRKVARNLGSWSI